MVSIDALFEVVECLCHNSPALILDHRAGGFVVEVRVDDRLQISGSGDSPAAALKALAVRALTVANDRAQVLAVRATTAAQEADSAQRLAIQAKRVVDGSAQ